MAGKIQNAVQTAKQPEGPKTMKHWIQAMEPQIAKALPSVITPERFTRIAMTAISTNPKLAECTPNSFMGALMNAAQLGLEPNTPLGQAYLIPFKNKGRLECQFQLGYKGLIDLAYRSGEFQNVYAKEVYEEDEFSYEYGLEPKLVHKPYIGEERGDVIFYYAVFRLGNGGFGFEVMSRADVLAHAKRFSKAYVSGPWQTDFDAMARKTVLKKVLKYAPIKTDFVRQVNQDGTIKEEIGEDMTEIEGKNIFEGTFEIEEEDLEPAEIPEVPDFVADVEGERA